MVRLEVLKREKQRIGELRDLLDSWGKDFVSFTKLLDVEDKAAKRIKVQQSPILTEFENGRTGRDYVLKARQVYFTTWELARDIWFFITRPGTRTVILCHSQDDNAPIKTLSERIDTLLEGLKDLHPDVTFERRSQIHWVRIHADGRESSMRIMSAGATLAAAEKKGRSGTIHRLHVTEVSFFEYAKETLSSILACVPNQVDTGSEITFESTPRGAVGVFYEGYHAAKANRDGNEYKAHLFQWFKQPEYRIQLKPGEVIEPNTEREKELTKLYNISSEQLKWYRQQVNNPSWGQAKVDQEFISDDSTCWLFDGRVFFDQNSLIRLRGDVTPPIEIKKNGDYKIWIKPEQGKQYIVAADPSGGEGGDPAAAIVLEKGTGRYCARLKGQFRPDVFASLLCAIAVHYNWATLIVERNQHGHATHLAISTWKRLEKGCTSCKHVGCGNHGVGYPHVYHGMDKKPGWNTTSTSRPMALEALEAAIRNHEFAPPDIEFIEEAFLFIVKDDKPQAAPGAHDDMIMCAAIGWNALSIPTGLKHTQFGQSPSVSYERTPISFEAMPTHMPNADALVEAEKQRWAGGSSTGGTNWSIISMDGSGSVDGF